MLNFDEIIKLFDKYTNLNDERIKKVTLSKFMPYSRLYSYSFFEKFCIIHTYSIGHYIKLYFIAVFLQFVSMQFSNLNFTEALR